MVGLASGRNRVARSVVRWLTVAGFAVIPVLATADDDRRLSHLDPVDHGPATIAEAAAPLDQPASDLHPLVAHWPHLILIGGVSVYFLILVVRQEVSRRRRSGLDGRRES